MTSPSPGQIARYLKNHHYKTDEEYLVRARRRDGARIPRHRRCRLRAAARLPRPRDVARALSRTSASRATARSSRVNVEALNHAVRGPAARPHAHARVLGLDARPAPHRRAAASDIVDIVLKGRPQAVSFPGANPRHGHEWKVWQRREAARRQDHHSGRDRFHLELRRASGAGGRPHRAIRAASSAARTSSPASTAASAPLPAASRSIPRSCG